MSFPLHHAGPRRKANEHVLNPCPINFKSKKGIKTIYIFRSNHKTTSVNQQNTASATLQRPYTVCHGKYGIQN